MAATTHTTALKPAQPFGFAALIETAKNRLAQRKIYRQTVNELSALSARDLADLGLRRSMIRRVAMQAAAEYTAR